MKIHYAGFEVELAAEGALWIPGLQLLAVADLHLEKGSFFKAFSTFLPPYDTAVTLERLGELIARYSPSVLVAAGDSFHDQAAIERMRPKDRAVLDALVSLVEEWHWIVGNHDPEIAASLGGLRSPEYYSGGIVFRHRTLGADEAEVSGHYHPKTRVVARGHKMTGPCFLRRGERLILPSFGHYTGGLSIDDDVLLDIAPQGSREVYMIHGSEVFQV